MIKIFLSFFFLLSATSMSIASSKGEAAKRKTKEAYAATKDYSIEQKDEFVNGAKKDLKELDQKIEGLKADASSRGAQVSSEVKSQIELLDQQRMELKTKIDRLQSATKSAWDEMRSGVVSAFGELKGSFNRASAKFNEQK